MNFHRRNRMDQWLPAELAIYNAIQEVEKMPADVRLTDAVILLGKAKDCVSNYIESEEETEQQPEGKVLRIGKIDLWGIFSDHAKETGKEFTAMEKNHIVELFDRVYKFQSKLLQPQVEEGKPPFFCEQWQMNQDLLLKHRREPCKAQCDYCNPFKESQVEEGNKEKEEK
jgi:hypothetical protein